MSCIFCNIIKGKLPSKMVYQDDQVVAFYDINPKAKVHILIVPRKHIASVNQVKSEDRAILGSLFLAAQKIAEMQGIAEEGYRLTVNTGSAAGQIVYHLHMHLLGGGVFND
ncbi:MAG: histidine triad nucleotide-binding protein [Candidatus Jacksonbacteria bacterium]